MLSKKLMAAGLIAHLLMTSGIAAAEEEAKPADKRPEVSAHHDFRHSFDHDTFKHQDVLSEAAWGGVKGSLIGLGTGLAVSMISYAASDRDMPGAGRLNAALVGSGFIAGAIFGGVRASMVNSDIDRRQDKLFERYGSISPTLNLASSGVGMGLAYSLSFN